MKEIKQNYHDYFVTGILTNLENDSLEIKLELNEQIKWLRFLKVKRCLINGFTLGNIVLGIECFTTEESINSLLKHSSFNTLFDASENLNLQKTKEAIQKGFLVYVEIQPSYGCSALILCENIIEEAE